MENNEEHRLKVEKGLEREAVMLGLRLKYIGIFVIFCILSFFPLMFKASFETGVLCLVLGGASYVFTQYADNNDLLEIIYSERLPKILINDLYKRLKSGTNKTR